MPKPFETMASYFSWIYSPVEDMASPEALGVLPYESSLTTLRKSFISYQLCEPALHRTTYLHIRQWCKSSCASMASFCDVILGGHLSSKYYGYCVQQVQRLQLVPLTDAATRDVSADIHCIDPLVSLRRWRGERVETAALRHNPMRMYLSHRSACLTYVHALSFESRTETNILIIYYYFICHPTIPDESNQTFIRHDDTVLFPG